MAGTRDPLIPTLLVVLLDDGGKYDGCSDVERSSGFTTLPSLMSSSQLGASSSNGDGSSCAISREL